MCSGKFTSFIFGTVPGRKTYRLFMVTNVLYGLRWANIQKTVRLKAVISHPVS